MFSSVADFLSFYSKRDFERTRQLSGDLSHRPLNHCLSFYNFPQKSYKVLHVAGTSGKGSMTLGLSQLLKECGYTVGTFVSPHYISIYERILYNGFPISEPSFLEQVEKINIYFNFHKDRHILSFFEILTFIAFSYFEKKQVDWAVIETGLGGRYDCTNNVAPEAVILTPIGMDHSSILGNTIQSIIDNKAGIMKPRVPVFSFQHEQFIHQELRSYAKELSAPYHNVSLEMPSSIHFIVQNAYACFYILKNILLFSEMEQKIEILQSNLQTWCYFRGQLEKICNKQGYIVIFDSAHNLLALKALCNAFAIELQNYEYAFFERNVLFCSRNEVPTKKWKVYIGILKDRSLKKFILMLIKQFQEEKLLKYANLLSVTIIQDSNLPLYSVQKLGSLFSKIESRYGVAIDIADLGSKGKQRSLKFDIDAINVVCGSIYLYAPIKKYLQEMV